MALPRSLVWPIVLLVLSGCGVAPEITKRYGSATHTWNADPDRFATASVSIGTVPKAASAEPAVLRLSPQGQAAFMKAIGDGPDKKAVLTAMRATFSGGDVPRMIDTTHFSKRLFFSISKAVGSAGARPGDRIEETTLVAELPTNSAARFESISKFETEFQSVNLGSINAVNSDSFTGGLHVGPAAVGGPNIPVDASATYTRGRTITEAVNLVQQIERFSPQIQSGGKRLVVYRQGVFGLDLTGTFYIDVELVMPCKEEAVALRCESLFGEKGPKKPGDFHFDLVETSSPSPNEDIPELQLSGQFTLRRVVQGADTLMEGDDQVEYAHSTFKPLRVPLLTRSEVLARSPRHSVVVRQGADDLPLVIGLDERASTVVPVLIADGFAARDLVNWMQADQTNNRSLDATHHLLVRRPVGLSELSSDDMRQLTVTIAKPSQAVPLYPVDE